jgi:hypothetical protein
MKFTTSLFSQILQIVPRLSFLRLARECGAERHAKGFSWDQYVAMVFCQFAQAKSLREISDGLAVTCGKLSHLGLRTAPAKSTLSYANAHRPWQLYQNAFFHLRDFCRSESPGKKKKFRFKNPPEAGSVSTPPPSISVSACFPGLISVRPKAPLSSTCCWITTAICRTSP